MSGTIATASPLTPGEIDVLDPYTLLAVIGKRVIHPGGRRSTEELFDLADFQANQRVLDVGCGVATTDQDGAPPEAAG